MNVGDYVRTDIGIGKYISDNEIQFRDGEGVATYRDIIKSSPELRSVLQEDDFVNGEKITRVIPEDICGDEILDYQHIFIGDKEIYEEDIKSIVTKEQF